VVLASLNLLQWKTEERTATLPEDEEGSQHLRTPLPFSQVPNCLSWGDKRLHFFMREELGCKGPWEGNMGNEITTQVKGKEGPSREGKGGRTGVI
jgi:hypothetical protein